MNMSSEFNGGFSGDSFAKLICKYIGETVTIFTKSGGQSGSGFTGVVLSVNDCFLRLITRIGPAPGCALGNACNGNGYGSYSCGRGVSGACYGNGFGRSCAGNYGGYGQGNGKGPNAAGGFNGYPVFNVGSVTDIPIDSIASFVHNAI
jgi:hypothetical protein